MHRIVRESRWNRQAGWRVVASQVFPTGHFQFTLAAGLNEILVRAAGTVRTGHKRVFAGRVTHVEFIILGVS